MGVAGACPVPVRLHAAVHGRVARARVVAAAPFSPLAASAGAGGGRCRGAPRVSPRTTFRVGRFTVSMGAGGEEASDEDDRSDVLDAEDAEEGGEAGASGEEEVEEGAAGGGSEAESPLAALLSDEEFRGQVGEESAATLDAELASLRSDSLQAAALEETLAMQKDTYLRLNADFENFRRRSAEDKAAASDRAVAGALDKLLPVIDAFDNAKKSLKLENEGEEKINAAYQAVYSKFMAILGDLGIEQVPGLGAPFDPEFHEAIMREETNAWADGVVMEEFRPGFRINGQLVRAAMVKVAQNDSGEVVPQPEGDDA